jgi:hypothetical protein
MKEITSISKDRTNSQQGFKFRGIDDVYNELHSILANWKVFTLPEVIDDRVEERTSKNGNALIYRVLKIKYHFCHEDGSSVTATVIGEGMDSGDKAANKAMSIAHKYCLFQAFLIPTDEEKDPDSETHEVKPKQTYDPYSTSYKPDNPDEPITERQLKAVNSMYAKIGGNETIHAYCAKVLELAGDIESTKKLTKRQAAKVIDSIAKELDKRKEG